MAAEYGPSIGSEDGSDVMTMDRGSESADTLDFLRANETPEDPGTPEKQETEDSLDDGSKEQLSPTEYALSTLDKEGSPWNLTFSDTLHLDSNDHIVDSKGTDITALIEKNASDNPVVNGDFSDAKALGAQDQLANHEAFRQQLLRGESPKMEMGRCEIPDKDGNRMEDVAKWVTLPDGSIVSIGAQRPSEIKIKEEDEGDSGDLNGLLPDPSLLIGVEPTETGFADDDPQLDFTLIENGAAAAVGAGFGETETAGAHEGAGQEAVASIGAGFEIPTVESAAPEPITLASFDVDLVSSSELGVVPPETVNAPAAITDAIEPAQAEIPAAVVANVAPEIASVVEVIPAEIHEVVSENMQPAQEVQAVQAKAETIHSEVITELHVAIEGQQAETITAPVVEPEVFDVNVSTPQPAVNVMAAERVPAPSGGLIFDVASAVRTDGALILSDAPPDEPPAFAIDQAESDIAVIEEKIGAVAANNEVMPVTQEVVAPIIREQEDVKEIVNDRVDVITEVKEAERVEGAGEKVQETITTVPERQDTAEIKATKIEGSGDKTELPKEADPVLAVVVEKSDVGINLMKLTEAGIKAREAQKAPESAETVKIPSKESPAMMDNVIRGRFESRPVEGMFPTTASLKPSSEGDPTEKPKQVEAIKDPSGITLLRQLPQSFRPLARQAA